MLLYVAQFESQEGAVVEVRQAGGGRVCLMGDRLEATAERLNVGWPSTSWESSSSSPCVKAKVRRIHAGLYRCWSTEQRYRYVAVSGIPYISGSARKAWLTIDEYGRNSKAQGEE